MAGQWEWGHRGPLAVLKHRQGQEWCIVTAGLWPLVVTLVFCHFIYTHICTYIYIYIYMFFYNIVYPFKMYTSVVSSIFICKVTKLPSLFTSRTFSSPHLRKPELKITPWSLFTSLWQASVNFGTYLCGAEGKNPPTNAGDMGSVPDLRSFHVSWSN